MRSLKLFVALVLGVGLALPAQLDAAGGWNPFKKDKGEKHAERIQESREAIRQFLAKDDKMSVFFDRAYGYAIFPTVGKGGIGIGGAHGKGIVFRRGEATAATSLSQVTVGFQLGGQAYSEVIFFKDRSDYDRFMGGEFEFGAQASAVAADKGAATNADYSDGVAVFTLAKGGLMYEATVAGQKFTVEPLG